MNKARGETLRQLRMLALIVQIAFGLLIWTYHQNHALADGQFLMTRTAANAEAIKASHAVTHRSVQVATGHVEATQFIEHTRTGAALSRLVGVDASNLLGRLVAGQQALSIEVDLMASSSRLLTLA